MSGVGPFRLTLLKSDLLEGFDQDPQNFVAQCALDAEPQYFFGLAQDHLAFDMTTNDYPSLICCLCPTDWQRLLRP